MKGFCFVVVIVTLLFVQAVMSARHMDRQHSHSSHHHPTLSSTRDEENMKSNGYGEKIKPATKHRAVDQLQIVGSSLPDCSHACGSCSPCRLVMVSYVCASLAEAETCPMAYKCMCNNKSYPVP